MSRYASATAVGKEFGITSHTLRRWEKDGKVSAKRLNGVRRYYDMDEIRTLFNAKTPEITRSRVIYARVSSRHQHSDLERQIADLRTAYPTHEVVSDVGSGLNFHRPNFTALLERVRRGMVQEIVVSHRDRLCRFAIELVEWLFEKSSCTLVVHGGGDPGPEEELRDDLLAIVTTFVARNNGLRSANNRRERRARDTSGSGSETSSASKRARLSSTQETQDETEEGDEISQD